MIRKGILVNLIQLVQVAALVGITILVTRVTGWSEVADLLAAA